jgi:hypothetical protein
MGRGEIPVLIDGGHSRVVQLGAKGVFGFHSPLARVVMFTDWITHAKLKDTEWETVSLQKAWRSGSWWGWRGLNPHVGCPTQDFKSCAYANFATSPLIFSWQRVGIIPRRRGEPQA